MNRQQKIALLKTWGLTIKDEASLADARLDELIAMGAEGAKAELNPTPASAASNVEDIATIRAELKAQKKARLQEKINAYVDANRITKAQATIFLASAMASAEAETEVFAALAETKVEAAEPPVGDSFIVEGNDTIVELTQKKGKFAKADERQKILARDWTAIYNECCARDERKQKGSAFRGETTVFNGNTLSATVTTSFLLDGALTPLQNMLAPLRAFSIDFSTDPYKPLATAVLKNPTAFPSTKTDATNFTSSSDSTIGPISVTMHQYTQPFNVSNADLNSGLRMQDLVVGNVKTFASKLIEVATAPVTTTNFTATPVTSAPAAFGFSDLAYLQGQLKKSPIKNVILDGEYIANVANTPAFFQQAGTVTGAGSPGTTAWAAFGWDLVALNTDWTGAGTNVRGFACHPQAIVGVAGLPLTPISGVPGGIFSVQTMTCPDVDISVALYNWFDVNTRVSYTSYDVMLGVALGDGTAGVIVKSA